MNKLLTALHSSDWRIRYALVLASVAIAVLLRLALVPVIGWHGLPYLTLFLAIVFSAWIGGFGAGIFAVAVLTLIACCIQQSFAHPFAFTSTSGILSCVLFVLEGIAITALGEAQRVSKSHAHVQTERAEASMQSANRSLDIIREGEMRNATVLEVALDCIITIDQRGCITDFNPASETTFGYKKSEVLGHPVSEIAIPASHRDAHHAGLAHYLETGEGPVLGKRIEITAMRRSGEEFPVELAIIPAKIAGEVEFTAYLRDISERKRAEQELIQAAVRQRLFLRDVLFSVTQGHLRLCDTEQELPPRCPVALEPITLNPATGMAGLRAAVKEAARDAGFPDERTYDLITAASEAAMNAIVHVGEGVGEILFDPHQGVTQVRVTDHGAGIAFEDLPHATLQKGFTTAGTLGHGMKLMLETTDRLFLLTGTTGTTVVLEQYREAPLASWLA